MSDDIDWGLDALIEKQGGYSTKLKWEDRQKLRAVVKKIHMRHYPEDHMTDFEADRIIDVIAPGTAEYLVRKHIHGETFASNVRRRG